MDSIRSLVRRYESCLVCISIQMGAYKLPRNQTQALVFPANLLGHFLDRTRNVLPAERAVPCVAPQLVHSGLTGVRDVGGGGRPPLLSTRVSHTPGSTCLLRLACMAQRAFATAEETLTL